MRSMTDDAGCSAFAHAAAALCLRTSTPRSQEVVRRRDDPDCGPQITSNTATSQVQGREFTRAITVGTTAMCQTARRGRAWPGSVSLHGRRRWVLVGRTFADEPRTISKQHRDAVGIILLHADIAGRKRNRAAHIHVEVQLKRRGIPQGRPAPPQPTDITCDGNWAPYDRKRRTDSSLADVVGTGHTELTQRLGCLYSTCTGRRPMAGRGSPSRRDTLRLARTGGWSALSHEHATCHERLRLI